MSKQRNEEECKKAEIHSVGNAAADHTGHHLRLFRYCAVCSDTAQSVQILLRLFRYCSGCSDTAQSVQILLRLFRYCSGCSDAAQSVQILLSLFRYCAGCSDTAQAMGFSCLFHILS
jgi:hypothetical protein